jgi:hypothetical protein
LGARRAGFREVGVTIEVRLGGGICRDLEAELERPRVWGTWAWVAGVTFSGFRKRRRHQSRPCPAISSCPLLPLAPPALDSRPCSLNSALGCPTAQSLHAPWGAPGPGAGGSGGPWAWVPGCPSSLKTRCPGARLSPGSSIQG